LNGDAAAKPAATRFVAVRFGNVLGSSGSVVPIFRKQIEAGGPVTVTHPDMKRYFMTIPEASQLVMQAGAIGQGGEIFILDMGEPVRILDLAYEMIRRAGLKVGEDIELRFSGVRPGEKLYEELSCDNEQTRPTAHRKIRVWQLPVASRGQIQRMLERLMNVIDSSREEVVQALAECIPEYNPDGVPRNPIAAGHLRLVPPQSEAAAA
jgi:FlaA1/EpsC-like NDP-sugar epimerase